MFFSAVNKAVDLAVEFAVLDCNFKTDEALLYC